MHRSGIAGFILMAVLVAASGVAAGAAAGGMNCDFDSNKLSLRRADGALAVTLVHAATLSATTGSTLESKIRFDFNRLNADGLQGPPDGLRALHYEYCIPDRPEAIQAVVSIDPTLEIQRGSPGRVGCGQGELLCLGHTHQPGHRGVLQQLAALAVIAEIHENFFE
jgi:hypothetical protein